MGWGFSDILGDSVGGFIDDLFGIDDAGISDRISRRITDEVEGAAWAQALEPGDPPSKFPYLGAPFTQATTGWSVQKAVEATGSPGTAASGLFFIGHATEGMAFDRLIMTLSGVDLQFFSQARAGWSVRLIQRTPAGGTLFISGVETGVTADGTVVREDLQIGAGEAGRVRESYGGPIEPYLPMFLNLATFGDIGAVTSYDETNVQISAGFLQQAVR